MSKTYKALGVLLCGTLGGAVAGHTDIRYTTEVRSGEAAQDPKAPPMMKTIRSSRAGELREETTMQFGPVKMQTLKLMLCDKHQVMEINPSLKIYTVAALDEGAPAKSENDGDKQTDSNGRDTGKMIITTTVKDLGQEEVAGRATRHALTTMRMQSSGCAGKSDTTMKMEMWTAPGLRLPMACVNDAGMLARTLRRVRPTCKISYEYHGDTDATRASAGIPLRTRMFEGDTDKVTMEMTVTDISEEKLADTLFTVPADYKQVTEEEFRRRQSMAMMQSMTNAHQQDNNDKADGDEQGDQPEGNAGDGNDEEAKPEEKAKDKEKGKNKLPFKLPF